MSEVERPEPEQEQEHEQEPLDFPLPPASFDFLVMSLRARPEVKRVIAAKAFDRFKQRIREVTRRAKSVSIE